MKFKSPFTILVVDDETPIYELLVHVAEKQFPEAQFVNAHSIEEASEYLNNHLNKWPNLVLLDIDLRQTLTGLDFLPQLRHILDKKVPIVILAALAEEPNVKRAYENGAAAYTRKPDDLQGWHDYIARLKAYWYHTNSTPLLLKISEEN